MNDCSGHQAYTAV